MDTSFGIAAQAMQIPRCNYCVDWNTFLCCDSDGS